MACTMVCLNSFSGGVSSSKIVLVGFLFENQLQKSHHAYAHIDDKSNLFMICLDLANKLDAAGTKHQVFPDDLQRWKRRKVWATNFWCSVALYDWQNGEPSQLIKCANIPKAKHEIAMPEIARQFSPLKEIDNGTLPLYTSQMLRSL